jgi:hypothetical protein
VFSRERSNTTPLPAAVRDGRVIPGVGIRLDDGRVASLRVEQRPCDPPGRCAPVDCGCHSSDSYWIIVVDRLGGVVARIHLWAAYSDLEILPFDLVAGPGDELVIVRALGRSAPPNGKDLRLLQLAGAAPIELIQPLQIAGNLSGTPMVCGLWRSRLVIDETPASRGPSPFRTRSWFNPAVGWMSRLAPR